MPNPILTALERAGWQSLLSTMTFQLRPAVRFSCERRRTRKNNLDIPFVEQQKVVLKVER